MATSTLISHKIGHIHNKRADVKAAIDRLLELKAMEPSAAWTPAELASERAFVRKRVLEEFNKLRERLTTDGVEVNGIPLVQLQARALASPAYNPLAEISVEDFMRIVALYEAIVEIENPVTHDLIRRLSQMPD